MASTSAAPATALKAPPATKTAADIVRTRLITRDSLAVSTPSAKRVAAALLDLVERARFRDDPEAWQQAEDSFQTELATFQLSMRTKCTRVKERCVKERQAYAAVHADIDKSIGQARDDITRLTEELAQAKRLRAQREQYEALAKVISEHAARKQSEVTLQQLDAELAALQKRSASTDAALSLRTKQFQLLLHTVWDLQQDVAEGEDEEDVDGAGAGAEAGAGADGDVEMKGAEAGGEESGDDGASEQAGGSDDDDDDDDDRDTRRGRDRETAEVSRAARTDDGDAAADGGDAPDGSPTPGVDEDVDMA